MLSSAKTILYCFVYVFSVLVFMSALVCAPECVLYVHDDMCAYVCVCMREVNLCTVLDVAKMCRKRRHTV